MPNLLLPLDNTILLQRFEEGREMVSRSMLAIGLGAWLIALSPISGQLPTTVGDEFQVNTYTSGYQRRPAVATNQLDGFLVVWESDGQDGSEESVQGQRFDASGTPLGGEFQVNDFTIDEQRDPTVAFDPADNSMVLWTSWAQDGDRNGVQARRYDLNGQEIGSEFQINSYTTGNQAQSDIALSGNGWVVVWSSYSQDGSGWSVQGRRLDLQGAPTGVEIPMNSFTTGGQNYPSVASSPDGTFIVVWQSREQDGSDYGIFGQRFKSDDSLDGPEFPINTYTTARQKFPDIALAPQGHFLVTWQSYNQDGSGDGIFAQTFDADGNPIGGEIPINAYTTSAQVQPTVAATSVGEFIVTWGSLGQDNSGYAVEGRRFAADGAPIGGEFQVNSNTAGRQDRPAIATSGEGGFVVAWTGSQDESVRSIQGQMLSIPIFSDGFESGDTTSWSATAP